MKRNYKCPFCGERLHVDSCVDGGFTMGCLCAFQGPEKPTKLAARKAVASWLDKIEHLQAKVALLEHEADCHWCEICSPGEWTRGQCPDCKRLQEAVKAAENGGDPYGVRMGNQRD